MSSILEWPIAASYCPNVGGGGCGVLANEYICAHGAQINTGDLTPYLTYVRRSLRLGVVAWEHGLLPCSDPCSLPHNTQRYSSLRCSQWRANREAEDKQRWRNVGDGILILSIPNRVTSKNLCIQNWDPHDSKFMYMMVTLYLFCRCRKWRHLTCRLLI